MIFRELVPVESVSQQTKKKYDGFYREKLLKEGNLPV